IADAAASQSPTWETTAHSAWLSPQMPRGPMLAGVLEVLLRVDLNVSAGSVDRGKYFAGFDHFLEQQDLVGLLEHSRFTPRLARELFPAAMIMLPQTLRPFGRELGDANVLAVGDFRRDAAVNARDAAVGDGDLF